MVNSQSFDEASRSVVMVSIAINFAVTTFRSYTAFRLDMNVDISHK